VVDTSSYGSYRGVMRVGTKELKNRLSHYLRLVRGGDHVEVTDRGAIVAEIRAARVSATGDDECLIALEQRGLATLGRGKPRDVSPLRASRRKLLSEIVIADRD